MALAARKLLTEEYIQPELIAEKDVAKKSWHSFIRRPVFISFLISVMITVGALKMVGMNAQIARYQLEHNSVTQEVTRLQNESAQLDMEIQRRTLQPEVMTHGKNFGLVYPTADKIHVVSVPATAELQQPGVTPAASRNWLVNSGRNVVAALSGTMSRLGNGTDTTPAVRE